MANKIIIGGFLVSVAVWFLTAQKPFPFFSAIALFITAFLFNYVEARISENTRSIVTTIFIVCGVFFFLAGSFHVNEKSSKNGFNNLAMMTLSSSIKNSPINSEFLKSEKLFLDSLDMKGTKDDPQKFMFELEKKKVLVVPSRNIISSIIDQAYLKAIWFSWMFSGLLLIIMCSVTFIVWIMPKERLE